MGLMHQGHCSISCALVSGGYAGQAIVEAAEKASTPLARYKGLVRPEMETCLDQFNPLRMKATAASSTSHQPGFFHGLSTVDRAKALRDALLFLKSEFKIQGMTPVLLRNMLYRLIFRRYDIPAAQ